MVREPQFNYMLQDLNFTHVTTFNTEIIAKNKVNLSVAIYCIKSSVLGLSKKTVPQLPLILTTPIH